MTSEPRRHRATDHWLIRRWVEARGGPPPSSARKRGGSFNSSNDGEREGSTMRGASCLLPLHLERARPLAGPGLALAVGGEGGR